MKIRCPKCNVGIGIKPKHLGRTIACPKCQNKLRVPDRKQDDVPVVHPVEEYSQVLQSTETTNDPFADQFADPFADQLGIPPGQTPGVGLPPASPPMSSAPSRRRKKKPVNWKLWGMLGAGLLGLLLFVAIAIPFVSGFLEAIQPRTYNFQLQQTYSYDAEMSVPFGGNSIFSGTTWKANIDYSVDAGGKISWTTNMKSIGGSPTANATFSSDPETGSFDLPSNGFGGLSHANRTHMFPFFIGPAATLPIIPLSPGRDWTYTQNVSLEMDQPMFGLQPGDQLKAVWKSQYRVKFEERNQAVITEERTIETTDGKMLLRLSGEHTYDDRVGILSSDLRGSISLGDGRNQEVPFEIRVQKK